MESRRGVLRSLQIATAILFVAGVVAVPVVGGRSDGAVNAAATAGLPNGPAGSQLRWVLSRLGKGATERELRAHFVAPFLEQVPAPQMSSILVEIGSEGPFEVAGVQGHGPLALSVVLQGPRGKLTVDIRVEAEPPHRIAGLLFKPVEEREPYDTFEELVGALRKSAPEVGFLAADVSNGECTPVHAWEADRPLALGSAFKLYVLGAVAEEIEAGRVRWDQVVQVRDDQLVHTSQRFGASAEAREASVQTLAKAMIEVSDNTATDVLLDLVGRIAVEGAQARMGMRDPAANVPFLSTREMTLLKWGRPPLAGEFLRQQGAEARRRFLDRRLAGQPAREQDVDFTPQPNHVDSIEWFASPADLCRAHVALADLAARPGLSPIRDILGANPGLPFDRRAEHVSFKGGSEPGVLAGAWLIEGPGQRRHVIVILLRNGTGQVDTNALRAAEDAYRLLLEGT